MTTEQEYLLYILRKSLQIDADKPEEPDDLLHLEPAISRNGILQTVFGCLPSELQSNLSVRYNAMIKQSILQSYEGEQVLHALSDAGMECIALKGWEMRNLYPKPLMRQMADLDVLVRPYRYATVKKTMEQLGFSGGSESSWKHDSFRKNEVHVEMHKRLTDDSGAIQKWEAEMWERAVPTEHERVLKMSPEDYYIFHFVHLHKDFMNGALGLRRIADTWLLQKQNVNMDTVKAYLTEFDLWTFHERMITLCRAAMGDIPVDGNSEILLAHAFRFGIYGSDTSYKAGRIAKMGESIKSGKRKSAIAAVFLPYHRMKAQFPGLEKRPYLLPYYWGKRIVRFLKGDLKKSKRKLDYSSIDEKDFEEMKQFFKAGGVR